MKKLISLVLILAACFALGGCKEKNKYYEPVESTKEEATTVMTLKYGKKTYEVKYELYRALFLTYRDEISGGDNSVWNGPLKDTYVQAIQKKIISRVSEIYSAIALAEELGLKPYSGSVDKEIKEYVKISVEGGSKGGMTYDGYGDYDAYLESLKAIYLNYSAQALIFRYAIVSGMIDDYYMGELTEDQIASGVEGNPEGKLEYTKEDVRAFYESDECVRILRTFVSEDMDLNPEARAERVRAAIVEAAWGGEEAVRYAMIDQGSTTAVPELEAGYVMGMYNLSGTYYEDMIEAAFTLEDGGVSDVVRVHDGERMTYYVIYRAAKSAEHFEENYPSIAYIYLRNEIGKKYAECAAVLSANVSYTDFLKSLDHSAISM